MSTTTTTTTTESPQLELQEQPDTIEVSRKSIDIGKQTEELDIALSAETTVAEDESQYVTGTKLWLIMFSMCIVLVVGAMDASIVAVAVPTLTDHWHTVADVGWYSSAFRLCMCSFQFMFGKLYKLFNMKIVFLASVAIFILASLLCATAPTSLAFIVGRAVSGFATSGIIAGCFSLLGRTVPLRKRPLYSGTAAAVEGVSDCVAPIIGGILIQRLSWRWCFWINLPLGGLAWILVLVMLPNIHPLEKKTWRQTLSELDLIGNLVFVPALTCLFMALSWAGTRYAWNSPIIIGLLCTFVVLLVVFGLDQWLKGDSATLPLRILKNRSVIAGAIFSLCCNSAMNVIIYYLPTYFQAVREYSPGKSGYLMLPEIVGFVLFLFLQGAGISVFGYYAPFMLAGSILMPIFTGLLTTLTPESKLGKIIAYSALVGIAGGIGFQAPQIAVQNSLPPADAPLGLAIIIFAQAFGPALFISLAQTIFVSRLSQNLQGFGLSATNVENMGLSDLKNHIGAKDLGKVLLGIDNSLMQTWYLAVGLTCVTMIGSVSMKWKSIKQKEN